MRRLLVLILLGMLLPQAAGAQEAAAQVVGDVAEAAAQASVDLQDAVTALQEAGSAKDRVAALTRTIKAYEAGLAALREALRQAQLRETTLTMQFQAKRDALAQLLGVLGSLDPAQGPLLLLHPGGPLGTARSGMMLAAVTPALQAEADGLRRNLQELADLRELQTAAGETLTKGLGAATQARADLNQAISDRTDLPKRFAEDPETLKALLNSADTLDAFSSGLSPQAGVVQGFDQAQGSLPWPVLGTILVRPGETDSKGVTRPGLSIATRALALVTSPWAATIRYRGPLLDYGNVMILEPGGGYLVILSGLETVYGEVGDVVGAGQALGLMGGTATSGADILTVDGAQGGDSGTETLYVEIRQRAEPVDPLSWFEPNEE
ncbi:MAG: peptidoglycan DD-metalloendopeptidase family protein [Candidatus Saccharibacteria bacterium]|nr:peptidoglycan DD-metalloendopeptidase family protein [Pseudorhodobacter sp.]